MSSTPSQRRDAGAPGRRALGVSRLFRRDWRQHLLILSLLTVAIAAAVGFSVRRVQRRSGSRASPSSATPTTGSGSTTPIRRRCSRSSTRRTAWFGEIDAIGHRPVPLPGTVKQIDYRSQQPDGPFGKPLLRLRAGRYPVADDEVAVTNSVAEDVGTSIGSTIDLDGVSRNVVGIVENPSKLGDDFVLLPPSALAASKYVTMLVDASEGRVNDFRPPGDTGRILSGRGDLPEDVLAAVLILVVSTLVLVLVALIATSSFMVIAQRRLPQLGMMSAIGATEKHLRLTMLATGAVTGVVAAVVGTVVGLGRMDRGRAECEQRGRAPSRCVQHPLVAARRGDAARGRRPRPRPRGGPAARWPACPPCSRSQAGHRSGRRCIGRRILAIVCLVGGAVCLAVGSKTGSASGIDLVLISVGHARCRCGRAPRESARDPGARAARDPCPRRAAARVA